VVAQGSGVCADNPGSRAPVFVAVSWVSRGAVRRAASARWPLHGEWYLPRTRL